MSNWISVKDRLPPANTHVLVFMEGNSNVFTGVIICNDWYVHGWRKNPFKVTHWMPPPSPPTRKMAVLTVPHYNS